MVALHGLLVEKMHKLTSFFSPFELLVCYFVVSDVQEPWRKAPAD